MSQTTATAPTPVKPRRILDRAVIRFAGDSGDGMQLTGEQFTTEAAWAGNDISTLPNFPAEIRAPAGTLFGVSSFQLQFGSQRVYTPGDRLDCLVAMNPAALKVHLRRPQAGRAPHRQHEPPSRSGTSTRPATPRTRWRTRRWTSGTACTRSTSRGLTHRGLEDLPLNAKEKDRCKNFFALGLVSWIYTRPLEPTLDWIKKRFAKNADVAEANTRVLKAGHAFGETAEIFAEYYGVEPAEMAPGRLPEHDRQPRARVGPPGRRAAHQAPGRLRRLSDHAGQRHPARAGDAQALPRPHLPGRGRDRGGRPRPSAPPSAAPSASLRSSGPGHRAQGRGHRRSR